MAIDGQGNATVDDEILEEYPATRAMKSAARRRRRLLFVVAATVIVVVLIAAVSASVVVLAKKNKTPPSESINKDTSSDLDAEDPISTSAPTGSPTTAIRPLSSASVLSTEFPSALSRQPSLVPSFGPTGWPTITPVTTFYAVGDAPYSVNQAIELTDQMANIPEDAEFVIHIGDIRSADDGFVCKRSEYEEVASTLSLSRAPVFLVVGDNEWNGMK